MDLDNEEYYYNKFMQTHISNKKLKENFISKDVIRERLKKLKEKEQELSDEQGYWGGSELQARIEELEELLGE